MKQVATLTLVGLLAWLAPSSASAVLVVGNTFDLSTNNAEFYTNGQVTDANVTSTGVGRPGYTRNGGYNALVAGELRGFVQPVNNSTRYFSFEITPINGATINLTDFTYKGFTTLNSGTVAPDYFQFRSSVANNYNAEVPGAGPADNTEYVIDLSGAAYQNITSTIGFRLYVQADDNASSGTTYSLDNFAFNGSVVAVPEASSFLAMSMVGIGCTVFGLRRKNLRKSAA